MTCCMRAGSVAAGVLILWIWSTVAASAEPAAEQTRGQPVPVIVQVPTTGGPLTVTLQVSPATAGELTELRVTTNADATTPVVISTTVGASTAASALVDSQHSFDWKVSAASDAPGCGPHPPAGTPGCSPPQAQQPATQPAQAQVTAKAASTLTYTVQPGDTLRAIAQRFYGDPAAFTRIAQANAGRVMTGGRIFGDPSAIRPGWQLDIPEPSTVFEERADGRSYIVQPGDTLNGIAARLLGDASRWSELYALNGSAAGGSLGTNPNLVQPGMQLQLPAPDSAPGPAAMVGVPSWPR